MINLKKIAMTAAIALVTASAAFGAIEIAQPSVAEAKNIAKKVKIGGKYIGKGFAQIEKAGRAAQRARGIGKPVGGILKTVGSAGRNGTRAATRGVSGGQRAATKALTRSKAGKAAHRVGQRLNQGQTRLINNAFRNCRGHACAIGKDAVKFVSPF